MTNKKTYITLENSFHDTKARILVDERVAFAIGSGALTVLNWLYEMRHGDNHTYAVRTLRRLKNELCGAEDCTCGIVRD